MSESVVQLLQSSKSEGTWAQYTSSINKWIQFCEIKKWCAEDKSINHYLEFLAYLYDSGFSYNTINTARSALSSVFGSIENVQIGEHKLIVDLMKGISRMRPVRPRYDVTWDPDLVLNYLKSIKIATCSLKELTLKVVY